MRTKHELALVYLGELQDLASRLRGTGAYSYYQTKIKLIEDQIIDSYNELIDSDLIKQVKDSQEGL
jgi:hypothetical protein